MSNGDHSRSGSSNSHLTLIVITYNTLPLNRQQIYKNK